MFDLGNKSITVKRKALSFENLSQKYSVSYQFKICIVDKGEGVWEIGNKLYTVKNGDIVLLSNRQKRVFRKVSLNDGIELIIVEFEPQFIFNTPFYRLFVNSDEKFNCKISEVPEISRLMGEMEQEICNQNMHYRIMLGAKLIEILSLLERHYNFTDLERYRISKDMHKVLTFIDENYTSDLSLHQVAHLLHMSITSFSKYFSRCMGMGFAKYVMEKRINRAIYLLEMSDKTVMEIALDCGFNNPASFYKAFKKITNKVPNDYKNPKGHNYI